MKQTPDLTETVKHRDPFVVPDGYFDTLADRVMQRVKAEEAKPALVPKPGRILRFMRWSVAACVVVVAGLGVSNLLTGNDGGMAGEDEIVYYVSTMPDDDWNEAMDYAMVNNMDIAYLLTEAY